MKLIGHRLGKFFLTKSKMIPRGQQTARGENTLDTRRNRQQQKTPCVHMTLATWLTCCSRSGWPSFGRSSEYCGILVYWGVTAAVAWWCEDDKCWRRWMVLSSVFGLQCRTSYVTHRITKTPRTWRSGRATDWARPNCKRNERLLRLNWTDIVWPPPVNRFLRYGRRCRAELAKCGCEYCMCAACVVAERYKFYIVQTHVWVIWWNSWE